MLCTYDSVALDRGADLLGAGGDVERGFGLEPVLHGLFGDARAPAHVLVRAVRAGADQADLYLVRPAVLLRLCPCI